MATVSKPERTDGCEDSTDGEPSEAVTRRRRCAAVRHTDFLVQLSKALIEPAATGREDSSSELFGGPEASGDPHFDGLGRRASGADA